jgi:hypothetical protein
VDFPVKAVEWGFRREILYDTSWKWRDERRVLSMKYFGQSLKQPFFFPSSTKANGIHE